MVLCQNGQVGIADYNCYLRCTAKCLEITSDNFQTCQERCSALKTSNLCSASDTNCWESCSEIYPVSGTKPNTPQNLQLPYSKRDPSAVELKWSSVPSAALYVVQYGNAGNWKVVEEIQHNADEPVQYASAKDKDNLCGLYQFRVAAANGNGAGPFSDPQQIQKAELKTPPDASLEQAYLNYSMKPFYFADGSLADNDSIHLGIRYTPPKNWVIDDIEADLLIAPYQCSDLPISRFIPKSEYTMDPNSPVIHVQIPGIYLRANCRFALKFVELRSKKCGTKSKVDVPILSLHINCDTVQGSPCKLPQNRSPTCAFTKFSFRVVKSDAVTKLKTVELHWRPLYVSRRHSVLHYAVRWGPGTKLSLGNEEIDRFFNDLVTIDRVEGQTTACNRDQRDADSCHRTNQSAIITGLRPNELYGVQICAVYDAREEFPSDLEVRLIQSAKMFIP